MKHSVKPGGYSKTAGMTVFPLLQREHPTIMWGSSDGETFYEYLTMKYGINEITGFQNKISQRSPSQVNGDLIAAGYNANETIQHKCHVDEALFGL